MLKHTHISSRIFFVVGAAVTLFLLGGCMGGPEEIPEDLEPIQYFQRAQRAASNENDYEQAIHYYETFIERHPDNIQRVIEAKYEIAFLHYKRGNLNEAKQLFENLLQKYEEENENVLPPWPRVLAQEVLNKIKDKQEKRGHNGNGASQEGSQ